MVAVGRDIQQIYVKIPDVYIKDVMKYLCYSRKL